MLLCQFLVPVGNRFWLYILLCTWSTIQLWCCVSFVVVCLVGARSLLRLEKKRYSRLSGGCAIIITTEKKRYSRLSGRCAIIITTGKKKDTVVCLAGARSLLRPEKKDTVVCLAGARSLFRPEKKKIQSSVWRVRDDYYDRKKKDSVVCLLSRSLYLY